MDTRSHCTYRTGAGSPDHVGLGLLPWSALRCFPLSSRSLDRQASVRTYELPEPVLHTQPLEVQLSGYPNYRYFVSDRLATARRPMKEWATFPRYL